MKPITIRYESGKDIEYQVYELVIKTEEEAIAASAHDIKALERIVRHLKGLVAMAENYKYRVMFGPEREDRLGLSFNEIKGIAERVDAMVYRDKRGHTEK